MPAVPVISVVGWSNSGKTTFIEKLIGELKKRGYRVGTVKHHHKAVELDIPGKDTYRHAQAGADAVIIAGSEKIGLVKKTDHPCSLAELIPLLEDMDIIITEGFKQENTPKIEIFRQGVSEGAACRPEQVIAVVSDVKLNRSVPVFDWNDAAGAADLIEQKYLR